uniref:(northern house mosquito) hypothetical protein n=1 Tax=Culex pipiens TaxID=7175 RepID=A0A8D8K6I9_CULPI
MLRNSFALVRLLRISATSNVGRWLISSVSTCVLSAVHASRILSRKSRCLNTKCCSSDNDFCISSKSDAISDRIWSRASACVFTVWFRCSSVLAHARHSSTLHLRHHSAFGIACVRQFSPLLLYFPEPIAPPVLPPPLPPPIPIPFPFALPLLAALPLTALVTLVVTLLPTDDDAVVAVPFVPLLSGGFFVPFPLTPPTLPPAPTAAVDGTPLAAGLPLLEIMLRFCDRYRIALCVGRFSGFMSASPLSSVRFQQCTQYSSLPFISTCWTHLRQK